MAFAAGASASSPAAGSTPATPTCPGPGARPRCSPPSFGCDVDLARALVGAAVRETFEETGVLLTVPAASLAHRPARRRERRARRSASCWPSTAWRSTPTRCGRGRAGSRRRPRVTAAATTPASSSRRCRPGAEAADLTSESSIADWTTPATRWPRLTARRARADAADVDDAALDRRYDSVAAIIAGAGRTLAGRRPARRRGRRRRGELGVMPDGTQIASPIRARPGRRRTATRRTRRSGRSPRTRACCWPTTRAR